MKVEIKPLLHQGQPLKSEVLKKSAPIVGRLQMAETKSKRLGRTVITANLFDTLQVARVEVTTPLIDARVVHIDDQGMRIVGTEVIGDRHFYQCWDVRLPGATF